jgi:hypothetical protein
MQFIPSSWEAYGVDANGDGRKDPYNPVDAICAAGRYLDAAGASEDLRSAIFAYNHADWYVEEVMLYARQYGRLPDDLVGSLTGLTEGARFPVAADSRYADDISEREAARRAKPGSQAAGNASDTVTASPTRRGINIYSEDQAPVIAVNDGVIREIGESRRLGNYVVLEDSYGNRFTYAQLGEVAEVYPVGKDRKISDASFESAPGDGEGAERRRLFAFPERQADAPLALGGPVDRMLEENGYESFDAEYGALEFDRKTMELAPLRKGAKVIAGTILGEVGTGDGLAPHVNFSIRPAGRGAPSIDPKPILDGWKLLEATHIYRASGKDPFETSAASAGQVLLMSKEQATRAALGDGGLQIYPCGRQDIETGQIDVRVLRMLLYLSRSGFDLTITSLKCGHSTYTTSGSISHHSIGGAVDIAAINGQPILGNQGPGTLSHSLVEELLKLQGTMVPDQIISLMDLGGPTFVMSDHADHVHVGYAASGATGPATERQFAQILKPDQWRRLIGRLAEIDNPRVPRSPSRYSLPAGNGRQREHASPAHKGE